MLEHSTQQTERQCHEVVAVYVHTECWKFATTSTDFPITASAYDAVLDGPADAFLIKLDADLENLLAATYLGGNSDEATHFSDIVVAESGVYLSGMTYSADFPTTAGAYDTTYNGGAYDGFVVRLDDGLTALTAATLIGGSSFDLLDVMKVSPNGQIVIAGTTHSSNYPTTAGAYDQNSNGLSDAFVTSLAGDLSTVSASTLLGSSSYDTVFDLLIDDAGDIYITGHTFASNFPVTAGAYDTTFNGGPADAYIARFDSTLGTLSASTLFGGTNRDIGAGLTLDASGNLYVYGQTTSTDLTTFAASFDDSYNGS